MIERLYLYELNDYIADWDDPFAEPVAYYYKIYRLEDLIEKYEKVQI